MANKEAKKNEKNPLFPIIKQSQFVDATKYAWRMRPNTKAYLERIFVNGLTIAQVASEYGLVYNSVYNNAIRFMDVLNNFDEIVKEQRGTVTLQFEVPKEQAALITRVVKAIIKD